MKISTTLLEAYLHKGKKSL